MLTLKIRILIIILLLLSILYIVNMVRRKRLELRYALIWLFTGIIVFILTLFPNLIKILSDLLGIYSPINMLFFMGFGLTLIIIFSLTIFASRMSIRIKELSQEIALRDEYIDKCLNKQKY